MSELRLSNDGLDEEIARAEVYGLLAQLYQAPPAPELLANLRVAATEAPVAGAFLEEPFRQLVGAARACSDDAVADEFEALFGGVGKPEVFVYGSFYLAGFLNEKPLAALRGDLAALGLARDETRGETEDHIAGVFEVMRFLIAGDDIAVCNLEQQRRFFRAHVQTWAERLCDAVEAHPQAALWRHVGAMTRAFVQVEAQGFDLLEL